MAVLYATGALGAAAPLAAAALPVASFPVDPLGPPLIQEDAGRVVERIRELHSGIDAISASVTQVKRTPLIAEEIETTGTIVLKKPNMLFWEVTSPEQTLIVVDGKYMWVYQPTIEEATKMELARNARARQAMGFFSSSMEMGEIEADMTKGELAKKFTVNLYETTEYWAFEFIPKSRMVKRYLASIRIWYRRSDGVPVRFDMSGKKGSETETVLTAILVNPEVDDAIFDFKPPPGVWVIDDDAEDDFDEEW